MPKQLKLGDLINVMDWEGKVLQRRAVNVCGNLVFVCTDEELHSAQKEQREPVTVGWPLDAAGL
jgi:hypothetical protein